MVAERLLIYKFIINIIKKIHSFLYKKYTKRIILINKYAKCKPFIIIVNVTKWAYCYFNKKRAGLLIAIGI
jgi:hypothetical protein